MSPIEQKAPPPPTLQSEEQATPDRPAWAIVPDRAAAAGLLPFAMPAPGREVTFVITPADVQASSRSALRFAPGARWFGWSAGIVSILGALFLLTPGASSSRPFALLAPENRTDLVVSLLFLALLVGGALLFAWAQNRAKDGKPSDAEANTQLMRLTPDYLYVLARNHESKTSWNQIARIEDAPDHLFFRLPGSAFLPVPKRAFANAAEAQAFYTEAVTLWHAAGGGTS